MLVVVLVEERERVAKEKDKGLLRVCVYLVFLHARILFSLVIPCFYFGFSLISFVCFWQIFLPLLRNIFLVLLSVFNLGNFSRFSSKFDHCNLLLSLPPSLCYIIFFL